MDYSTSFQCPPEFPYRTSVAAAIAQLFNLDARNDDTDRQSLSTFIMQSDKLTASYLTALAAGGVDIDWHSWFEERVSSWDNASGADSVRILLRQDPPHRLPATTTRVLVNNLG